MPNRRRPIDPSTPLGRFALELMEMRRKAFARARTRQEVDAISVDKIAAASASADSRWTTSRTAIYAALSGARLASEDALCVMVTAWEEDSPAAREKWLRRRGEVEEAGIAAQLAVLPHETAEASVPRQATRDATPSSSASPESTPSPNPPLVQLKEELRRAARIADWNTAQLAQAAGLGRTTVYVALNPENPQCPTGYTVDSLSKALQGAGVDINPLGMWQLCFTAQAIDNGTLGPEKAEEREVMFGSLQAPAAGAGRAAPAAAHDGRRQRRLHLH